MRIERWKAADGCLSPSTKLIGGKQGAASLSTRSKIYRMIPDDVTDYIEPFLGGGSILIGKPQHQREIVNDVNPWVINYFKHLRDNSENLWIAIWRLIGFGMSAEHFHELRSQIRRDSFNYSVENAATFYVVSKWANNGIWRFNASGECNSTYCKQSHGRGIFDINWYKRVRERVQDVRFICGDYEKFLKKAVKVPESSIIILDPPYYQVETKYWKEWSKEEHLRLRNMLENTEARFILCYNDCEAIRQLYHSDCQIIENVTNWCCSNTPDGRGTKTELLITNFKVPKEIRRTLNG